MKLFSLLCGLLISLGCYCQTPFEKRSGLRTYELTDPVHGKIRYCMSMDGADSTRPVLLFLDGSGSAPLLRLVTDTSGQTLIQQSYPIDITTVSRRFHVVMISKPGVPFADTVHVDDARNYHYGDGAVPEAYTRKLSLKWRTETASRVLDEVLKTRKCDRRQVVVFGYSEGAQVAPHVAVMNKKVTHCIALVGSGINQFYSFIIDERMKAERGEITHSQAQANIDTLFTQFDFIYRDPNSTSREWAGHSYLRWASFCTDQPLEQMLRLKIPIYIAQGAKDRNGQILSYDYVKLEFVRRGQTNLTYRVYPEADHYFNEQRTVNGKTETVSRLDEVIGDALDWVRK